MTEAIPTMHSSAATSALPDFLAGGGEMGALIRAHDWAASALGAPDAWPPALKTALRLLLTSNHPMFIWWGPELIQFYNDAYRQTLGPERHPAALGQPGRDCWQEIWPIIGPQIDHVLSGRGATWHEDELVPVTRHGALCDVWWTYGFSPIGDETGIHGVLVICRDVTEEHESKEALRRLNEQLAAEVSTRQHAETALAIERDRMHAALGQSQTDLARQLEDWQQLHAMSAALLQARSLQDQFEAVLHAVTRFHGTGRGLISLYDPHTHTLAAQYSLGLGEPGRDHVASIPVGAGTCGLAFERRERVVVDDTDSEALCAPYRDVLRAEGIRALYSLPFFDTAGAPLGVLTIYFDRTGAPSERELRLADICAGQIGPFVERDRARAQAQREQERSHHILQTLKDGFVLVDREFRILQINAAGLAMDGRPESEIVGRCHWDVWQGSEHQKQGLAYRHALQTGEPVRFENNYDYFGRDFWFDVYAYPYEDGLAIL